MHHTDCLGAVDGTPSAKRNDDVTPFARINCCAGHDFMILGIGGESFEHHKVHTGFGQIRLDIFEPSGVDNAIVADDQNPSRHHVACVVANPVPGANTKDELWRNKLAHIVKSHVSSTPPNYFVLCGRRSSADKVPQQTPGSSLTG